MISIPMCSNCEHYCREMSRCSNSGAWRAPQDHCPGWAAVHGEWVPMRLSRPFYDEDVTVLLVRDSQSMIDVREMVANFGELSWKFDGISNEELAGYRVLFWMRHPDKPNMRAVIEEIGNGEKVF